MNDWTHVGLTIFVLFIVTNVWLVYRVLNPLRRLAAQTTDLANGNLTAFQQPGRGIQEIGILRHSMASMAGHVRRAQEESAAHHHVLTDGQESERARIAHELHDDTVQSFIAIAQSIDLVSNWMESDPARASEMLKLARAQAVESVDNLRRLIANLRPPALEELGLIPALQMLADNESEAAVTIHSKGSERRLNEAQELTLFRAAQEAIRNAWRQGHARQIDVEVNYQPRCIRLRVKDDGTGFQLPDSLDCLAKEGHYGLLGIQERVQRFNGEFHISSQPGKGTQIEVVLPVETPDQPTETVRDPVCGALIQPRQAYGSVVHEGARYYFCCPVCQGAFRQNPEMYLSPLPQPDKA